jgi:hypothetical protein
MKRFLNSAMGIDRVWPFLNPSTFPILSLPFEILSSPTLLLCTRLWPTCSSISAKREGFYFCLSSTSEDCEPPTDFRYHLAFVVIPPCSQPTDLGRWLRSWTEYSPVSAFHSVDDVFRSQFWNCIQSFSRLSLTFFLLPAFFPSPPSSPLHHLFIPPSASRPSLCSLRHQPPDLVSPASAKSAECWRPIG